MIRLLLIIFCIAINAYGEEQVKYAAVIFRHGDRTPVSTYPTDPWKNESLWPVKFGELTNTGKLQHYVFGKWLRQRYSHLISDNFDPTELYVRSTDVDRTLMSAQANLAGLYPPTANTVWNTQLMWQPIPVHTVPQTDDEILAMMKTCPAYDRELDKYIHSESYKLRLSKYYPLMDFLTRKTGMMINGYNEILDIYSTLYIETLYNFTLPKWAGIVYPRLMQEPACYSFTIQTATPYLARLKVGPLLKHINTHLVRALTDESGNHRKLQLYSGHDLTVGNVLNAMGLYDGKCPCYTSAIFFELIMDNATSTHYVRISYRNTTGIAEPVVLDIPNCGTKCSVAKFMELYENLLTVDWEYECFMQFPPILGVVFGITMFLCIIIYVALKTHYSRVVLQQRFENAYGEILVNLNVSTQSRRLI